MRILVTCCTTIGVTLIGLAASAGDYRADRQMQLQLSERGQMLMQKDVEKGLVDAESLAVEGSLSLEKSPFLDHNDDERCRRYGDCRPLPGRPGDRPGYPGRPGDRWDEDCRRYGDCRPGDRPGYPGRPGDRWDEDCRRYGDCRPGDRPGYPPGRPYPPPGRPYPPPGRPGYPGAYVCFAENMRGELFRGRDYDSRWAQREAMDRCMSVSVRCRPLGCR